MKLNYFARVLGSGAYLPCGELGIGVRETCMAGDGTPSASWEMEICLTNTGTAPFHGVIRMGLPLQMATPRFYLPGFMYGTNRGEAPLVVDSRCPRLRPEGEFPSSSWWMVRSDRLSHPCGFAYGGGRMQGLSASPYYLDKGQRYIAWQPGEKGPAAVFGGFGCALKPREIWYTLGYENAPWFFLDSHKYWKTGEITEENCFCLAVGETFTLHLQLFDYAAKDERALHQGLKQVYSRYHQPPRRTGTGRQAVAAIAGAIARDAWLEEKKAYAGFVFDRPEGFEYRLLPSISWTNGLAAATPMLYSAWRLGNGEMRRQALLCIEHMAENCMNEQAGLPFTAENGGVWSNCGWWYDRQPAPGHAAYLVGQFVYLLLKAYALEKQNGAMHPNWLQLAGRILETTEKSVNGDGEYPYILSDKTGAGLVYDSFSGAWCMAAAAYYSYLTGERGYLPQLLRSEEYYHRMYVKHQECYGGPLDIDKQMDSEGILAYIRAVRYLHAVTGREELLSHLQDGLHYEFTFKFIYNTPIQVPPLSTVGWSSCGGSITSVTNPHIHPMSSSVLDEMLYYLSFREDAYILSRMEDTAAWSCQCHNTYDKEYGYGKKGWMSERFCHSQGLLTEHYPDGSPASTWFALMPWACGSLLEGLTGDVWEREG